MTRTLRHWLAGLSLTALAAGVTLAQPQIPAQQIPARPGQQPAKDDGVEVLARGPVHEAFASTVEYPTGGGPVVGKQPPDAIEELPPDQKPEGDNVQWIPGYWAFDDDRADFIWISGFWRVAPPGRVWVPGSWREVRGGHQWVSGFWNLIAQKQQQSEIEYLPQPPVLLDLTPQTPAPTATCFYTPGIWIYKTNRYLWRPGYWVEHRSNWIWVGDHYRWTPVGYIHVAGYWDYTPEDRGLLFAPVYFSPNVYSRQSFVYTPSYVVSTPNFFGALFVRRGYSSYYFGDYFEPRYATAGYNSWNGTVGRGSGFALNISVGRSVPFDPLWSYYSVQYREDPLWSQNIAAGYAGRYNGDIPRPPRTLVQQNTVVNNVTNVNNVNNTNVNNVTNVTNVTNNTMLTSLANVRTTTPNLILRAVASEDRVKEQKLAKELTKVSVDRRKSETAMVARGLTMPTKSEAPRTVKIDVPQTATIRAQAPETRLPPARASADLKPEAKPTEKPKPTPVVFPPATTPVKPTPPYIPPVGTTPGKPKPPEPVPPVGTKPGKPKPPEAIPPVVVPPKPPAPTPPVVLPPKPPAPVPPVVVPPKPPMPAPPVVLPPRPPAPAPLPVVLPPRPPAPAPPPVVLPPRPPAPAPPVQPVAPPPAFQPTPPPRPMIPPPLAPNPADKPKDKPKK